VIGASGFLPDLADFRGEWAAWRRNATLRATVYEHAGAPRPLVIALHGWSMGWPPLDARILDVRPLYDLGLDVALLTLPFHGARTEGRPGSAPPYPSPRLAVTVEAVRQAVWDVRRLAAFLRAGTDQGRPLGLYGWSLGGYVSALLAGLEPGLAAVACANPAGSLAAGFGLPHLEATWSIIDPLRYPSRVAPDRTFVAAGRADAICPPAQAGRIARHLGTRSVHLHGGGHLARFDRAGLRAAVVRFFSETMG
jgi:dienelactone hydrolase